MKLTTFALLASTAALPGCFSPTSAGDPSVGSDDSSSAAVDDGLSGPLDDADDDDDDGEPMTTGADGPSVTDSTTTLTSDSGSDEHGVTDESSGDSAEASSGSSDGDGDDETESSSSDTAVAQCSALSADASTVALWHFDDGAGQVAVDASGNGRDLQLGPTAAVESADPVWSAGAFEGGISFTNADQDYATRNGGNTFPDNELTIEFWVRSTSDDYAQLFTAGMVNCFVATDSNGGGVQFGIGDGSDWEFLTAELPNGTLNDGAWHYIATTYDGSTMRAYADGLEIGSAAASTTLADPDDYKVGGRPANTFLDGDMDEVRVSDVARTAAEIAAAYDGCE